LAPRGIAALENPSIDHVRSDENASTWSALLEWEPTPVDLARSSGAPASSAPLQIIDPRHARGRTIGCNTL